VGLPALAFLSAQGVRKVACAVAKQQFLQPFIVKAHAVVRQFGGRHLAQLIQPVAVGVVNEAAVQVFLHIDRSRWGTLENLGPNRAHVGQACCHFGMAQLGLQVHAPACCQLGA